MSGIEPPRPPDARPPRHARASSDEPATSPSPFPPAEQYRHYLYPEPVVRRPRRRRRQWARSTVQRLGRWGWLGELGRAGNGKLLGVVASVVATLGVLLILSAVIGSSPDSPATTPTSADIGLLGANPTVGGSTGGIDATTVTSLVIDPAPPIAPSLSRLATKAHTSPSLPVPAATTSSRSGPASPMPPVPPVAPSG